MSTPLWLGSGSCPSFQVSAVITGLNCQQKGFSEFGGQSDPPVYYRKYSTSGGWSVSLNYGDGSPIWTNSGAGIGTSTWAYNDTTGVLPLADDGATTWDLILTITNEDNETNGPTDSQRLTQNVSALLSTDPAVPSGEDSGPDCVTQLSGDLFAPDITVLSKTQLRLTQTAQTSGNYSCTAGTFDFILSDPDSDADAITRALAALDGDGSESLGPVGPAVADIFAANIFSLWEAREQDTFSYQSGTTQLVCANLMPGVLYHVVIVWEQRTAAGDGSGDTSAYGSTWANSDTQTFDFRPTDTTFTTAVLAVPLASGYQKRIKSISLTPITG